MSAEPQIVADLARDGIKAKVERNAGGLWGAALYRRDGSLRFNLVDGESEAYAEAWLTLLP